MKSTSKSSWLLKREGEKVKNKTVENKTLKDYLSLLNGRKWDSITEFYLPHKKLPDKQRELRDSKASTECNSEIGEM